MFTENDYKIISEIVFDTKVPYPGYRPNIVESPDGDNKWDTEKRYAHVALKYLDKYSPLVNGTILYKYLEQANNKAIEIAIKLGVPKEFWPDIRYGVLRILEYPPGAITHPHFDFDLFTLMCYRNISENFIYTDERYTEHFKNSKLVDREINSNRLLAEANKLNYQIHFGEILELLMPEYKATRHEVKSDDFNRTQYSIVYFSIPFHDAKLPDSQTVKEWLDERLSRSRKEVEVKY